MGFKVYKQKCSLPTLNDNQNINYKVLIQRELYIGMIARSISSIKFTSVSSAPIGREKLGQPNQCGATMITSASLTSKIELYI